MKKLYEWMLSWGNSKYGWLALFLFAFAESSFFPIPPDVLLIALCLGAPSKSFKFAAVCTLGSVCGAIAGYSLGYFLWQNSAGEYTAIANWFYAHVFSEQSFVRVEELYNTYNFWIVFTAGFTPIPYKVITVSAGLFNVDFVMFLIASIVSRGARFFIVSGMIWKFGAPIKGFIDKYFNLLALAFTVLLIGGFVLIKYLL
ncbi:MAG: VTT domain-containing protein [Rikenellaceae bacterium]